MGHAAPRRADVAPEVGLGHGGDDDRSDADAHLECMGSAWGIGAAAWTGI